MQYIIYYWNLITKSLNLICLRKNKMYMSFLHKSKILLLHYAVYYLLLKLNNKILERSFVLQKMWYAVVSVLIKNSNY